MEQAEKGRRTKEGAWPVSYFSSECTLYTGGIAIYIRGSNGIRNRILRTSSERVKGQMLVLCCMCQRGIYFFLKYEKYDPHDLGSAESAPKNNLLYYSFTVLPSPRATFKPPQRRQLVLAGSRIHCEFVGNSPHDFSPPSLVSHLLHSFEMSPGDLLLWNKQPRVIV